MIVKIIFEGKNRNTCGVPADLSQFLAWIVAKKKRARQARFEKKSANFTNYTKGARAETRRRKAFLFIREYSCLFVVFATLRLRARERFTEKNSDENYVPAGAL